MISMKNRLLVSLYLAAFSGLPACVSVVLGGEHISLEQYLPEGYVTDGSVSYQKQLQEAIDEAAVRRQRLVLPPMRYLVSERGLELRSGLMLEMSGATFLVDREASQDGAVFHGHDVTDVTLVGGE